MIYEELSRKIISVAVEEKFYELAMIIEVRRRRRVL
jgi:hypothetical protein